MAETFDPKHATKLGLREFSTGGPGEIGLYHNVIVAQKPNA